MPIVTDLKLDKRDFKACEWSWPENGLATSAMIGDSVAVIAWIPHFLRREELPDGFFQAAWNKDPSIPDLLSTGNPTPPPLLEKGKIGLIRYLDSQDFRGAISILKPALFLGIHNKPVLLRFGALARPGFTTIRPGHFLPSLAGINLFDGGFGARHGSISQSPHGVSIRVFLRMKLGWAGQMFAKARGGKWPPWATLMVDYTFDPQFLSAHVDFQGTAVPSQRRYIEWRRDSDYSMETDLSEAGYKAFVEAGSCQDALATRSPTICPLQVFPLPTEYTIEELRSISFAEEEPK
jgi:hypothetical protein